VAERIHSGAAFAASKAEDRRSAIRDLAEAASDVGLSTQALTLAVLEVARQLTVANRIAALEFGKHIDHVESTYGSTSGRENAWNRGAGLRHALKEALDG
jgi:hypothetical protein